MHFSSLLLVASLFGTLPALAQTPDSLVTALNADGTLRMRLNTDGGLLVGGAYDGDPAGTGVPVEGAGTRMMWYPRKGAFRAGRAQSGLSNDDLFGTTNGTEWDAANVGDYSVAFGQGTRASASHTFAAGLASIASQQSAVAIGENNIATGAASVALGYHAHTNARQGAFVFSDRSSIDYLRAGVNHSANWRVSGGFRIYTSSNLSTGVTLQSGASVSNWGQANAVISTSTGAYLSTSGVWTSVSDVHRKTAFAPVSGEDVLNRLRTLPLSTWTYKTDPAGVRHMGPMAQDFRRVYGLGNDSTAIGAVDADGVALAAAQALEVRTRTQAERTTALETQNATLAAQNAALERRLAVLEARSPVAAGVPWGVGLLALGGLAGGLLSGRRRASA